MKPIETARLVMRNFVLSDSAGLHVVICRYEASEYAAYDQQWPSSIEEMRAAVAWFATGNAYLAVCLKEDGRLIGLVCLDNEHSPDSSQYDLGYVFDDRFHHKGYATEACLALIKHAFLELHARRLSTGTAADNVPSCRLLDRLGFRLVKQAARAFRTDDRGRPFEFLGNEYVLERQDWEGQLGNQGQNEIGR